LKRLEDCNMHQAIKVYEVLRNIHRHCKSKRDLANFARVCSAWLGPAIDELWQELDDFEPLLNMLGPLGYCNDNSCWVRGILLSPSADLT
jgi:hypothetical protein